MRVKHRIPVKAVFTSNFVVTFVVYLIKNKKRVQVGASHLSCDDTIHHVATTCIVTVADKTRVLITFLTKN